MCNSYVGVIGIPGLGHTLQGTLDEQWRKGVNDATEISSLGSGKELQWCSLTFHKHPKTTSVTLCNLQNEDTEASSAQQSTRALVSVEATLPHCSPSQGSNKGSMGVLSRGPASEIFFFHFNPHPPSLWPALVPRKATTDPEQNKCDGFPRQQQNKTVESHFQEWRDKRKSRSRPCALSSVN